MVLAHPMTVEGLLGGRSFDFLQPSLAREIRNRIVLLNTVPWKSIIAATESSGVVSSHVDSRTLNAWFRLRLSAHMKK